MPGLNDLRVASAKVWRFVREPRDQCPSSRFISAGDLRSRKLWIDNGAEATVILGAAASIPSLMKSLEVSINIVLPLGKGERAILRVAIFCPFYKCHVRRGDGQ